MASTDPPLTFSGGEGIILSDNGRNVTIEATIDGWKQLTPRQRAKMIENIIKNPVERRAVALELAIMSGAKDRTSGYYIQRAYEFDKFLEEGRPENED